MTPLLHPFLVNGRTGDPAVYVETLFDKRSIMFDLGDIGALPSRMIYRLEHVFVSHTHLDHFVGFDRILRLFVGRDKRLSLYGPTGFIEDVHHKLHGYTWNLVEGVTDDMVLTVTEVDATLQTQSAQFSLKDGFVRQEIDSGSASDGVLFSDDRFRVSTAVLDHHIPCLGFAIEEHAHANIWKNKLDELGLPVGPWLQQLKGAAITDQPSDFPITVDSKTMTLGELEETVTVTAGQKIAYVTDVADTEANRRAIVALAHKADILFIDASFAAADSALANDRAHLTTRAAGEIGANAAVRRVEPFHFSSRYEGEDARMIAEVTAAFLVGRAKRES